MEEGKRKDLQKQIQNNWENSNKNIQIDNYLKCKQIKCSIQKTWTGWMNIKTRFIYMLSIKKLTSDYRLKVRGWKKIFHAHEIQKKARVAILISDKTDFKIKIVTRHKEGHHIMIKESIQEDITTVNIYVPNVGAPQYIRQMLTVTKRRNQQ